MGLENLKLIQGGMAIGVSGWELASEVAKARPGETMGVIAGTGAEFVMVRTLQKGDPGGFMRRALTAFPNQEIAGRILTTYFIKEGNPDKKNTEPVPLFNLKRPLGNTLPSTNPAAIQLEGPCEVLELITCGNFAQVWLAKEGHKGLVGINLLEKVQLPLMAALYGVMLADVDCILAGAGIPDQIPSILDELADHKQISYELVVKNTKSKFKLIFDPKNITGGTEIEKERLNRPSFLAVVANHIGAKALKIRTKGRVDGIVLEGPDAGGHNAKPRGSELHFNREGEVIFGLKDKIDFNKIKELNWPYWMAGRFGTPTGLQRALKLGARGIQVGTLFALSKESCLTESIKRNLLEKIFDHTLKIITDLNASASGFPFKVALLAETMSDKEVYENRHRVCDIGRLSELYSDDDQTVKTRCPAGPVDLFKKLRGDIAKTVGCKCLCNGLLATVGLGWRRGKYAEPPIVTLGKDQLAVRNIYAKLHKPQDSLIPAKEIVNHLFSKMKKAA